ncbi:MAG: galactokinase [Chryseolinea sp.]
MKDKVRRKFIDLYNSEPLMVRSPGRINLIGEHTDYNDGFVMPAAIDREMIFAIGLSGNASGATLYSLKHEESVTFDVNNPMKVAAPLWANYMLGVARGFIDRGYVLKGFNCVMDGDVPTGGGLSSSAALECGFAFCLNEIFHFNVPKLEMVRMAQWSEHNYVGVMCGIMDQFASMMSESGKAFVLDCRSLSYEHFSLKLGDYAVVLCDTLVKHSLAGSEYNTRRTECEQGVRIIQRHYPGVRSLRDVSLKMLEKCEPEFTGKISDRCHYVVEENQRVIDASRDLAAGDLPSFGKKMYLSHEGLSKKYEVSCDELDFLVDQAKNFDGVLGARMMGGGFGGCTINIVPKVSIDRFIDTLVNGYAVRFGYPMEHYTVVLSAGTSLIN